MKFILTFDFDFVETNVDFVETMLISMEKLTNLSPVLGEFEQQTYSC